CSLYRAIYTSIIPGIALHNHLPILVVDVSSTTSGSCPASLRAAASLRLPVPPPTTTRAPAGMVNPGTAARSTILCSSSSPADDTTATPTFLPGSNAITCIDTEVTSAQANSRVGVSLSPDQRTSAPVNVQPVRSCARFSGPTQ